MQGTNVVVELVHPDLTRTRATGKVPLAHSELNVALMELYEELDAEPSIERWAATTAPDSLELTIFGVPATIAGLQARALCTRIQEMTR